MWFFRRGPQPDLPRKPKKPTRPSLPANTKAPVIVRTYKADGFGKEKKVAKLYEDDARRLWADGYEPALSTAQGAAPASIFLGPGFSQLKGGVLTVTYKLTEAEQERQRDLDRTRTKRLAAYAVELAEYKRQMEAWKADCRRIREEFEATRRAEREAEG